MYKTHRYFGAKKKNLCIRRTPDFEFFLVAKKCVLYTEIYGIYFVIYYVVYIYIYIFKFVMIA